jgi:hypothetical protein
MLVKSGADPNLVNRILKTTPIHVAARKGNLQILKLVSTTFEVKFRPRELQRQRCKNLQVQWC